MRLSPAPRFTLPSPPPEEGVCGIEAASIPVITITFSTLPDITAVGADVIRELHRYIIRARGALLPNRPDGVGR